MLRGKHILLGVSGGIAAYKSAELVRLIRAAGGEVRVAMTRAAEEFVTPLTFAALSGFPVAGGSAARAATMEHIELARWSDTVLIAPASADCLARLAQGLADDLLTTLCLALEAPLAVAPAMNRAMWLHPATQTNVCTLAARGVQVWGPDAGLQACGEEGMGRMLEPTALLERLEGLFHPGTLSGVHVVVSAGPTREALDPVRYIGNRSSGRMGFAVAAAAARAGAVVTLIAGPVSLATPRGVARTDVESAEQMQRAALMSADRCDIFIGTAAVADYRSRHIAADKIKRDASLLQVDLERTADILATLAARTPRPFIVGFAAETTQWQAAAEDKRRRKGIDMVASNPVGQAGAGFDSATNTLHVAWDGGGETLALAPKEQIAEQLIALIARRYHALRGKEIAAPA